jgi:hypothetical protein
MRRSRCPSRCTEGSACRGRTGARQKRRGPPRSVGRVSCWVRHRAPSRLPLHTGPRPASPEGFEGLCVMQDTECVSTVTLIHPSNVLTGRGTFQVLAAHQELSKSGCTGACRSKLNPINGESGGGRQVVNGTAAAVNQPCCHGRPPPLVAHRLHGGDSGNVSQRRCQAGIVGSTCSGLWGRKGATFHIVPEPLRSGVQAEWPQQPVETLGAQHSAGASVRLSWAWSYRALTGSYAASEWHFNVLSRAIQRMRARDAVAQLCGIKCLTK